jgi:hypothetical protein
MEHHTDVSVHFDLQLVPGKLEALQASGALDTKLKLTSKISTGEWRNGRGLVMCRGVVGVGPRQLSAAVVCGVM